LELAKKVRRPKKKLGLPNQVNFHSFRNTFATLMKNGGVLWSHINHLMGYKDDNMILDVCSGGHVIKSFRESIG
jgi:integrase